MVNYHSEYMLCRDDANDVPVDFHKYNDFRKEEDLQREVRQRMNVTNCILGLDNNDECHRETYKRIMARGRPVV